MSVAADSERPCCKKRCGKKLSRACKKLWVTASGHLPPSLASAQGEATVFAIIPLASRPRWHQRCPLWPCSRPLAVFVSPSPSSRRRLCCFFLFGLAITVITCVVFSLCLLPSPSLSVLPSPLFSLYCYFVSHPLRRDVLAYFLRV